MAGCTQSAATADSSPAASTAESTRAGETKAHGAKADSGETDSGEAISLAVIDKAGYDAALARHRGHVVLVDFWATWCGPCKEQFPHTVDLQRQFKEQGLDCISLSCDDPDEKESVLAFLRQHQATFENLLGSEGMEMVDVLEVNNGALPHYRLYDREGKLLRTFNSGDPADVFKPHEIDAAVRKALDLPDA